MMDTIEAHGPECNSGVPGQSPEPEKNNDVTVALESIDGRTGPNLALEGRPGEASDIPQDPVMTAALIDVAIGLQDLSAKQDGLRELFEARIRSDEVQAKALEHFHDQVREYKTNFIRQEMQPLLRDLIYCYDFAADEVERASRVGSLPTSLETARAFDHLRQMVADILFRSTTSSRTAAPGPISTAASSSASGRYQRPSRATRRRLRPSGPSDSASRI